VPLAANTNGHFQQQSSEESRKHFVTGRDHQNGAAKNAVG
jgi:hypothetical protein